MDQSSHATVYPNPPDRVPLGSVDVTSVSLRRNARPLHSLRATLALSRRGIRLLGAKATINRMIEQGQACIGLPVHGMQAAIADLEEAGITATVLRPDNFVDFAALRQRLGMSLEHFAERYGIEAATLTAWETGKQEPSPAYRVYLRIIAEAPPPNPSVR